jgi:shikimate kinase
MKNHLFLTGFMGAGKSSVGQAVAEDLDIPFVDVDLHVVEYAGKNISQIFKSEGEAEFRRMESLALFALSGSLPAVVATGGGIVENVKNRKFMHENGVVIYLSAVWETLKARIGDPSGRPLALADDNWSSTKLLWQKRCPLYEEADVIIKTDGKTINNIVNEIKYYAKSST